MKNWTKLTKAVGKTLLLAALACPMVVSCYDDSALWDEVADLKDRVAKLEQNLTNEATALKALIAGLQTSLNELGVKVDGNYESLNELIESLGNYVTAAELAEFKAQLADELSKIISVEGTVVNADGSTTVTLTDGTSFVVYPEAETLKSVVTVITIDGVQYWAVYNDAGKAEPVYDEDGNLVPVLATEPQFKVDEATGLTYVSFDGGATWTATGATNPCIFTGCEINYVTDSYGDEWPATVTLTLPDGSSITVTLDGYGSFIFGNPYMGRPTTQMFIPAGTSYSQQVSMEGVAGYLVSVPNGWNVEEESNEWGEFFFNITAPSKEAIASGAAAAKGELKVLASLEGGKTITAKMEVNTEAFQKLAVSKGNAIIEITNGLGKYYYGVAAAEGFDPQATEESIDLYDYNALYDNYNLTMPVDELDPSVEMVPGETYVLWVVPAFYDNEMYEYYLQPGTIEYVEFVYTSVNVKTNAVTFNSIDATFDFVGVPEFLAGFTEKGEYYNLEEIVEYDINSSLAYIQWGMGPTIHYYDGPFTGSPMDFLAACGGWAEGAILPGKEYVMWMTPWDPTKEAYSVDDMYEFTWTTSPLTAGGSLTPVASNEKVEITKVTATLTAEGAGLIYYAWVEPEMVSTITDKAAYVLENGYIVEGSVADIVKSGLKPEKSIVLYALAVDANGAYGDVLDKTYTTLPLTYSDVQVNLGEPVLTENNYGSINATVTVTTSNVPEGSTVKRLIYFWNTTDSGYWSTMGGSVDAIQEYMALNPSYYGATRKTVVAGAESTDITKTYLEYDTDYVLILIAETADADGVLSYSKAATLTVTPKMDLGEVVFSVDDNGNENPVWAAAKPTVEYKTETIGDFGTVTWKVTDIDEGFTGYTYSLSKEYVDARKANTRELITWLLGQPSVAECCELGAYNGYWENLDDYEGVDMDAYFYGYAVSDNIIVVLVADAEGNYYEPYMWDAPTTGGGFAQ